MSHSNPKTLSIAICTYNRSYLLKEQVECLNRLQIPADHSVEVIYVDNNSTDDTERVLQEVVKDCVLPIRVFKEMEQGIAHARNRGWQEAIGEYVISLDDDAFPAEDWLVAYAKALDTWKPEIAGGPIIPFSELPPPRWLDVNMPENKDYVARLNIGDTTRWLIEDESVWESNMAIRRDTLQKHGGYDTNFGVKGKKRFGGEGVELQERLGKLGVKTLYISDASVEHLLSKDKLYFSYYLRTYYQRSKSQRKMIIHGLGGTRKSWKSWRWMVKAMLQQGAKAVAALTKRQLPQFAVHSAKCASYAGEISETLFGS